MLNWRRALDFPFSHSESKDNLFYGGLAMILVGPLGWFMALGYRRILAEATILKGLPAPRYAGRLWDVVINGLKSGGLIWIYFIPFVLCFWAYIFLTHGDALELLRESSESLVAMLILPPLLPVVVIHQMYCSDLFHFGAAARIAFTALFALLTFLMPAVFLQVPMKASYLGAANPLSAIKLIAQSWRAYVEAWTLALFVTAMAFVFFPVLPWMIFYSYVVILYAFNEALWVSGHPWARSQFSPELFAPKP